MKTSLQAVGVRCCHCMATLLLFYVPQALLGLIGIALSARFLVAKTYSTCTVKRTTLNNYFFESEKSEIHLNKTFEM